jgi:type I restriction enzyme S subunit
VYTNVSKSRFEAIELALPPLAEQRAIASVLGALDDKIELNRRMNATLEAMARALFQSWFVDFDPVRAKQEGRKPTGMDDATAAMFPASFQESVVGRIPLGWTCRTLGDVIDLSSGVPYEAKYKGDTGNPMVTLGCISFHDRFQEKGLTYYSGDYKASHVVKPDDLFVASHDVTQERKQLGSPAMVPRWLKSSPILAATNLYVVRNQSAFPNQFLYQLFRAEDFRRQMVASAKGTAILFISKDSILRHKLAFPPEALAQRFAAEAEALYSEYSTLADQSRTLATLRDTLLPKLLSGEISIEPQPTPT